MLVQDKNFKTMPIEQLLASEFAHNKNYVLFSDAYVIHAKDSTSFVKSNPFKNADPPGNWPKLIDRTLQDGYITCTDEERSIYNYFSWCAAKYCCGVVKFHLSDGVSPLFWEVLAARFRKMGKEYFLWKSGRVHNLEFDFYFGDLPDDDEVDPIPAGIPEPGGSPIDPPVETSFINTNPTPSSTPPPFKTTTATPVISDKPRLDAGVKDRFFDKRYLILVYWIQMATYCEIQRTFSWMNPLVHWPKDQLDALGRDYREKIASVTKGYRDVSFNPAPPILNVPIGGNFVPAIVSVKKGTKKLDKGISAALNSENSLVVTTLAVRDAEIEKLDLVDAVAVDDNVAAVPQIPKVEGQPPTRHHRPHKKKHPKRRAGSVTPPAGKK